MTPTRKTALIIFLLVIGLLGVCNAVPVNRGRCYPFTDLAKNGPLLDLAHKGRLYKTSDGIWRAYQKHAKVIEWEFSSKPIKIRNYGKSTAKYNVLQVVVAQNGVSATNAQSYFLTIGGGEECNGAVDASLQDAIADTTKQVIGVWYYPVAHWP